MGRPRGANQCTPAQKSRRAKRGAADPIDTRRGIEPARAPGRRLLHLPSPILGVAAFNFTLFLAWQIILPVLPLLALSLGASPLLLGSTVGASALLPILLSLPLGRLVDRLPPRTLQLMAALTMVAGTLVIFSAGSIWGLMAGQALVGLSVTVASIAGQAFIALVTDSRERDTVYGRYAFVIALDTILGPALGGVLAEWRGYRMAFAVALACALVSVPQTLWLPNYRSGSPGARTASRLSSLSLLRIPLVMLSLIAGFLIIFGYSLRFSFYVLYLDRMGFSSRVIGMLLSFGGAATIVTRPLLGWATGRFGRSRLLALICIGMGLGIGLVPVMKGLLVGQATLTAVTGIAYGLSQPLTITLLSHAVPLDSLGVAFGWRQLFQRGAELASPLLMGVLVTVWGPESIFWLAAAILALAGIVAIRATSH